MSERDLIQDLVVLFDSGGTAVREEIRLADFELLRGGQTGLPHRAREAVRAAYVTVGPGLRVAGLVFFVLPVDAAGQVPDSFNIPLQYLVEHAGVRSDLGIGAVPVASRAQCPVPWLAVKLWEPEIGEDGTARIIQRTVLMNRLGLNSRPAGQFAQAVGAFAVPAPTVRGSAPGGVASTSSATPETFDSGREAPAGAVIAPRDPSGAIEHSYLEQIRRFRAEILELKAALRLERDRNRRLQALLRGDF